MQIWTPDELKAWRQRMGWTQAETAERLGIGLRTYTDRENGEKVSMECMLACRMLEQLEVDFRVLIGDQMVGSGDLAQEIRRIVRVQRGQQIMFDALMVALVRTQGASGPDVANTTFAEAVRLLDRMLPGESPETGRALHQYLQDAIHSSSVAVGLR